MKALFASLLMTTTITCAGTAYAAGVEITGADTLIVDGNQWAQVDLFINLSWNDVNAACPSGICAAGVTLNGYDMSSWTWASVTELESLFINYDASLGALSAPENPYIEDIGSTWATAFFDSGWRPTFQDVNSRFVHGLLADQGFDASEGTGGGIEQGFNGGTDYAWAGTGDLKTAAYVETGAWFYRPSEVPVPAAAWLLFSALVGLGLVKRTGIQARNTSINDCVSP